MLRQIFFYSIVLFFLCSCTNASIFLINTLARFEDFAVVENIAYGQHALNRLDVYRPAKYSVHQTTPFPVVIFFYGGCWGGCMMRNKEAYVFVAQALTAQGYMVVLADYRRYPEVTFKQIIDDSKQSVEWVWQNIQRYGGDNKKLFLMGHSAGAHLAAMLTLNEDYLHADTYKNIRGFIGLAGPYDFLPLTEAYQKIVFGPEEKYPDSQPINFVSGTEPPLLLLYGNSDDVVFPVSINNLSHKIRQVGGRVESHLYDNIDHYSILGALSLPYQQKKPILNDIIHFLDENSRISDVNTCC